MLTGRKGLTVIRTQPGLNERLYKQHAQPSQNTFSFPTMQLLTADTYFKHLLYRVLKLWNQGQSCIILGPLNLNAGNKPWNIYGKL